MNRKKLPLEERRLSDIPALSGKICGRIGRLNTIGIKTVGDFEKFDDRRLLATPGIGRGSIDKIRAAIEGERRRERWERTASTDGQDVRSIVHDFVVRFDAACSIQPLPPRELAWEISEALISKAYKRMATELRARSQHLVGEP